MNGIERIAAERRRQIEVEGWTPEHDAEHVSGEMVGAAVAYAWHGLQRIGNGSDFFPKSWEPSWWKPAKESPHEMTDDDRIRHLEKAGALLAAEIDRLLATRDGNATPQGDINKKEIVK